MGKINEYCCKAIWACSCIWGCELAYRGGRAACVGLTWWSRWALLRCTCIEKAHLVSVCLPWDFMEVSLFFSTMLSHPTPLPASDYTVPACWERDIFLLIKILLLMGSQSRYSKSVLHLWLCSDSLNGLWNTGKEPRLSGPPLLSSPEFSRAIWKWHVSRGTIDTLKAVS